MLQGPACTAPTLPVHEHRPTSPETVHGNSHAVVFTEYEMHNTGLQRLNMTPACCIWRGCVL